MYKGIAPLPPSAVFLHYYAKRTDLPEQLAYVPL